MRQPSSGRSNPRSAWLVIGLAAGLLLVAALQGRLEILVWLLAAGSLLVLTALYALGFRRRSWANLATLEQRKFALSFGAVVLVLGMVAGIVSTPEPARTQMSADAEGLRPRPDLFALPTPPTTPPPGSIFRQAQQPSAESTTDEPDAGSDSYALLGDTSPWEPTPEDDLLADKPCEVPGEARTQRQTEYRCTHTSDGRLVWIERSVAERLTEERAAEVARSQERARQAEAQREQEMAEQRAAEDRAREAAQPPQPPNPPANQPQPPPRDPPAEPPNQPPTTPPTEPPAEPPNPTPTQPPTDPPTRPPNPDPTTPPTVPPTPPGPPDQPDRPDPLTPDPDIPVLPPEFPVPPAPPPPALPPPQRPDPPSSFASPSAGPDATQPTVEAALPASR